MTDTVEQTEDRRYIPALRWKALTPAFDAAVRITARERAIKNRLLDQAGVHSGDAVLDLGAGTGTLALLLKQRCPGAHVTGLDADPAILGIARQKASAAGCEVEFVEGFSTELPFPDRSLDVVLSTLFFHHLTSVEKQTTLGEVRRVLKPGGRLHVADWGKPSDPVMAALFLSVRLIDGWERTTDNVHGALPALFGQAGLVDARERQRLRSALGTLSLYSAVKPIGG
jgi:SAM-dependent methyltransferase